MRQFCKDVIDFLQSEYGDKYEFRLDLIQDVTYGEDAELVLSYSNVYKMIVNRNSMKSLYILWQRNLYIDEREQYQWQKELVDIIEGS